MFVIISGTNRPNNHTKKVARAVEAMMVEEGQEVTFLDLEELPPALFEPAAYSLKPEAFLPWQDAILTAEGILSVVPEYNGSFPGALKYFVDMLKFPESLVEKPAAFVGLSAGAWGGIRAVEQLEMVFQHRRAHLYGRRVFIREVDGILGDTGLTDAKIVGRLHALVRGFIPFAKALHQG